MLSRTADHLYWMARHMERAENMARILDVTHRMMLLPEKAHSPPHPETSPWAVPLIATGRLEDYRALYPRLTKQDVLEFLVTRIENPSSICGSILLARENARSVRGAITSEMWESLNSTWLEFRKVDPENLEPDAIGDFFDRVKHRSHMFRGISVGTSLHDEAYHFIRLGTFVERADNTARILDVKYHMLLPSDANAGSAQDYYQWGSLLRSVSAFEAYRKIYRDAILPRRVAELLILREDMPRSLHACMDEIHDILERLNGMSGSETRRLAGELHARLHYGRIDGILDQGLHGYLMDFLGKMRDLGQYINQSYFSHNLPQGGVS
jgi:uncharacterized alpha-E superfamily protein